jgi:hypothetical protein
MVFYLMTGCKISIIRDMTGNTETTVLVIIFIIDQVVKDAVAAAAIYKSTTAGSVGMTLAAATMDTIYKVRIR